MLLFSIRASYGYILFHTHSQEIFHGIEGLAHPSQ